MNADELAIYEFLKDYPGVYVSVTEISRRLGARHKFQKDRNCARPLLRRMEVDGIVEGNPTGEYRIKVKENQPTSFKSALRQPGVSLGETTLIYLCDEPGLDEPASGDTEVIPQGKGC
jgi:hypothetical protein